MQLLLSLLFIIASFVGGFWLAGGHLGSLWQPFEIMMLGGAALGFFFAGNSMSTAGKIGTYLKYCFKAPYDQEKFTQISGLMFALAKQMNKDALELNDHLTKPEESSIFKEYPKVLSDKAALSFLCNNFLLFVDNGSQFTTFNFEEYLEKEIEEYHHEAATPYKAVAALVDTMPAMGICAAVLGIILSMGYLDAPMEELGHHIGAALFGTFMGIFMAYGVFKPISLKFGKFADESVCFLSVIKAYLVSMMKGYEPLVASIITNKNVPPRYRIPDHELKYKLMHGEI